MWNNYPVIAKEWEEQTKVEKLPDRAHRGTIEERIMKSTERRIVCQQNTQTTLRK